jgi:impB/mucB/samB family
MRIACVHIPQFALQCATRIDPTLRQSSTAVVVVGPSALADARALLAGTAPRAGASTAPIVLACSRAAWSLGARVGMSATAARSLSPLINVLSADAQLERDTVRGIADVLLALSPVVEVGGRVGPGSAHLALYCEVPAKTRGTSFGDRLLDRLEAIGVAGRVGIADDRFTAWVAAWLGAWDASSLSASPSSVSAAQDRRHDETGVVSVPRGGSAAFLAPRPLSLLSITPEVQHMLESLGVRTIGEFAALPAPTVSSRAGRFEADYQALARGESGNLLRPYAPDAPIREEAVLRSAVDNSTGASPVAAPAPVDDGLSAPAAVALLAERVALRLAGRARSAARIDVTLSGVAGERIATVTPVRESRDVLSSAEQLAEAIGSALGDDSSQAWRMRVVVSGEALAGDLHDATADALDAALAVPAQRMFAVARAVPVHEETPTTPSRSTATSSASFVASASASGPSSSASIPAFALSSPSSTSERRRASASAAQESFTPPTNAAFAVASRVSGPSGAPPIADPDIALSIALSTTGSTIDRVFGLTSPMSTTIASAGERRDSHPRMRRGKQRRRAEIANIVQPRLFKM